MTRSAAAGIVFIAIASVAEAQAPARIAQPSTRATATVNLTGPQGSTGVVPAAIRIDYGQPHLRGRKLHTPELVPFDSVWRLGANEPTTLETGVDLTVGGRRLAMGKYTLWALPSSAGWKLIVSSNTGPTGNVYAAKDEVARIDLRRRALTSPVESFTIALIPSRMEGAPSGELRILWGDVELTTEWRVP
jgi:hypothetical protein